MTNRFGLRFGANSRLALRWFPPALAALLVMQGCGGAADKQSSYPAATGGGYRGSPPADSAPEMQSDSVRTVQAMPGTSASGSSDFDEERSDDRVASAADAPVAPTQPAPPPAPMKKPAANFTSGAAGGAAGNAAGPAAGAKNAAPATDAAPHEKTMLVYTAQLTMAVYQVEPGLDAVEKVARDFGGYLAVRGDRRIEIRVPREKFQQALRAIEGTGDVLHRDVRAEDVTDRYVDTESRLRNARSMRLRLQQLLERAQVKEAIEIEKELGRVTQEIELLEGKLKLLKDQIAFSTITVEYSPKSAAIARTTYGLPFPWLSRLGLPNLLRLNDHKESE